jgi:hypothetical protein
MESQMKGLAGLGRFEDDTLAHVATGEMIVPPQSITPQTRSMIESDMMNMGMNPNQYVVGGENSINPNTGMPEFGLRSALKKFGKKLKKIVKKVAPIAINFIPGMQALGPLQKALVTTGVGKASGMSTKEALLSGALSFGGSKLGSAVKGGKFPRLKNFFTPGEGAEGILKSRFGIGKGTLGPNIRRGIGQLFGQAFTPQDQLPQVEVQGGGGFGSPTYTIDGEPVTVAELKARGYQFDSQGNLIQPTQTQPMGNFMDGKSPMEFLSAKLLPQGVEDALGTGPGGTFLGGQQVDAQGNPIKGGGLGNLAISGLAGLVGKLAYEEAKRNKGVPLTPLTTMDQLGRYNIAAEIARQKGEEMPSRVEFGLNPSGLPVLQGGGTGITPRTAAMGGMIYKQADGDHNGIMQFADGGVVQMQNGGEPPIDPANFPPMDGDINGPGTETSDDIPAMLSDGEFVMTAKAVRGAGGFDMAKGDNGIVTLTPNGNPGRESGNRIMYKLMEHFGSMA